MGAKFYSVKILSARSVVLQAVRYEAESMVRNGSSAYHIARRAVLKFRAERVKSLLIVPARLFTARTLNLMVLLARSIFQTPSKG